MQTIEEAGTTVAAPRRWRTSVATLGAAASIAAVVGVVALATNDDAAPKPGRDVTTLTLTAPGGGDGGVSMGSCVQFDVAILRDMPTAFSGTVTEVSADSATLDVDRWYKGGTADQVKVTTPFAGTPVSIEGVEFRVGARYFVAAAEDGTVNGCGYSGPASAKLEQAYGEAFPG